MAHMHWHPLSPSNLYAKAAFMLCQIKVIRYNTSEWLMVVCEGIQIFVIVINMTYDWLFDNIYKMRVMQVCRVKYQ